MTKDGIENLHKLLRKARIDAGITQSALAAQVGCKQSAVSMMEAGRREAMAHDSLVKVASILKVELPEAIPLLVPVLSSGAGVAVCANFNCPSNMPYAVGDDVYFMPLGTAGAGRHCILCGELLARTCSNCEASIVSPGGCCGACGAAIIDMPSGYADDIPAWIQARLNGIATLRQVSKSLDPVGRVPYSVDRGC